MLRKTFKFFGARGVISKGSLREYKNIVVAESRVGDCAILAIKEFIGRVKELRSKLTRESLSGDINKVNGYSVKWATADMGNQI